MSSTNVGLSWNVDAVNWCWAFMECGTTICSHRHRWVLIIYLSWNIEVNSIHLVKITVPFETNISKAHDRKDKKCLDLVSDITYNRFICDLTCFEVGSHGLITPENIGYIAKISFVGATKPKKTFLGNSANWLSYQATRSGMLDRSRLGLQKPAPDFSLFAVLAVPFAASLKCLLLLLFFCSISLDLIYFFLVLW